jgi:hypothetical protein
LKPGSRSIPDPSCPSAGLHYATLESVYFSPKGRLDRKRTKDDPLSTVVINLAAPSRISQLTSIPDEDSLPCVRRALNVCLNSWSENQAVARVPALQLPTSVPGQSCRIRTSNRSPMAVERPCTLSASLVSNQYRYQDHFQDRFQNPACASIRGRINAGGSLVNISTTSSSRNP